MTKPRKILEALACRTGVDLAASIPLGYAGLDHARIGSPPFLNLDKDGKLRLVSNPQHLTLIEKLVRGEGPIWLKPVEIHPIRIISCLKRDLGKICMTRKLSVPMAFADEPIRSL